MSYAFHAAAGRYIVLCFLGRAGDAAGAAALEILNEKRALFDDDKISFFGVSIDPGDERGGRMLQQIPGIRHFWDFDGHVSQLYGAAPVDAPPDGTVRYRRVWFVLDPTLRIMAAFPFAGEDSGWRAVACFLEQLPAVNAFPGFEVHAPILVLPNVFEVELRHQLINVFETHGGVESGFMRDVEGRTVLVSDHNHKRRSDYLISDPELMQGTQARISRRVIPEIEKVHQFKVTRMERYLVGCYDAETGGHFNAHRDNTTKGTAHRRFAVSINLNADFEGGEISFPEYGPRSFKPPPGCAVVFSCSLLHALSKITKGRRFAFLPFLYDDAAAKVRQANQEFIESAS